MQPGAGDFFDTDIPDGQQRRHHSHALLIVWRAAFPKNTPVPKQAMPQNPFERIVEAEKAARVAVGKREVEGLRIISARTAIPHRDLDEADRDRPLENPRKTRL